MGRVVVVVLVLLGMLAAAMAGDRRGPRPDLVYIQPADVNTLDPQRMSHHQDMLICYAIFEPLVVWDNETFEVQPALAERWESSSDGLTWTFYLREGACWSNGDPVSAEDVRFAWQRALLPDTAADYTALFFRIRGGESFFRFRSAQLEEYAKRPDRERTADAARAMWTDAQRAFSEMVGIQALDERTLRVTLERPTPYFLDLCAFASFHPVHRATVTDPRWWSLEPETGRVRERFGWTKPPHLVCNGPYIVADWRFKRRIDLQRNALYDGPHRGICDRIRALTITDDNTGLLAFETGAADWHTDLRVAFMGDLLDQKRRGERDDIQFMPVFGTAFWSFNCEDRLADGRPNPFRDPAVRRAFARAVDKQLIVNAVMRRGEQATNVFIPPGSIPGFRSPAGLSFDPEAARAELAAAGWVDRDGDGRRENERGEPFPTVELLYTTGGYHKDVALALGGMWERHLGVRFTASGRDPKAFKDALRRRDYMLARGAWYGDYGDPTTFLDVHRTGDGNNDRGYSNPKYDELMRRADHEPDAAARMRLLEEAERMTMEEELPLLPLFQFNWYSLYRPERDAAGRPVEGGVRGLSTHPRNVQYLWKLQLVEAGDAGASAEARR